MTIEIGTRSPDGAPQSSSTARQALFEALRTGEGGVGLLRESLGRRQAFHGARGLR